MVTKSLLTKALILVSIVGITSCGVFDTSVRSPKTSHTGTHGLSKNELRLRNNIISSAKKHVGTKYRYGGKSPTGFDCSGFTAYVLQENGVDVTGPSYSQENLGKKIRSTEAKPGDLVFFRKTRTGKVYHVAMVYANDGGKLTVIHSTSSRGVVVDKLSESSYWRTKYITLRNVVSP